MNRVALYLRVSTADQSANDLIDFSNPATYLWLAFIVIAIPGVIGALLGAIAGALDEWL
jgi:hypothetical protein